MHLLLVKHNFKHQLKLFWKRNQHFINVTLLPFIQPFSSTYPEPVHGGSRPSRAFHTFLSPATFSSSYCGNQNCPQACRKISSLKHVLGFPQSPFPVRYAWKKSSGSHPGGILTRCLNHPSWLFVTWRSSCSTPSTSSIYELFALFLRVSRDTLQRKLLSGLACNIFHPLLVASLCQA